MSCDKAIREETGPGEQALAEVCEGPRRRWYLTIKSAVEWSAALVLALIVVPIIGILAIIVKFSSPGPAFYSQVRLGYNGKPYRIHKLRTMTHNCEATSGPVWSSGPADPRVTRVGRMLRDTHLDELPQIWNVLKGDMCLVGPRPERPEIASKLETALPSYRQRLRVKPGITGLAQVQLPPDTDIESVRRKLGYDLHYVREVGPAMDLKILFATFFQFLAAGINGLGKGLVKTEKAVVESHNYGDLKVIGEAWRAA